MVTFIIESFEQKEAGLTTGATGNPLIRIDLSDRQTTSWYVRLARYERIREAAVHRRNNAESIRADRSHSADDYSHGRYRYGMRIDSRTVNKEPVNKKFGLWEMTSGMLSAVMEIP